VSRHDSDTLLAVAVARRNAVDFEAIRIWSRTEGRFGEYDEFLREVSRSR
jgi:hypothetical protein